VTPTTFGAAALTCEGGINFCCEMSGWAIFFCDCNGESATSSMSQRIKHDIAAPDLVAGAIAFEKADLPILKQIIW
jgi:hypothetical protein